MDGADSSAVWAQGYWQTSTGVLVKPGTFRGRQTAAADTRRLDGRLEPEKHRFRQMNEAPGLEAGVTSARRRGRAGQGRSGSRQAVSGPGGISPPARPPPPPPSPLAPAQPGLPARLSLPRPPTLRAWTGPRWGLAAGHTTRRRAG